jgi:hypothetical protein
MFPSQESLSMGSGPGDTEEPPQELITNTKIPDVNKKYFFAHPTNPSHYYEPDHINFFKMIRTKLKQNNPELAKLFTEGDITKTVNYLKQTYPRDFEGKIAILKSYIDPDKEYTEFIDSIVAKLRGGKLRGGKLKRSKTRKNKRKNKSKSRRR